MKFNKLVRDKIPDMIINEGFIPETRILSDEEYILELDRKLDEEIEEYHQDKNLEELGDILEVLYSIAEARGYSIEDLVKLKEEKRNKRGGFSKKIYLISKQQHD